ncbi:WHG domain-containing protein, partial [Streptomyces sp. NPDC054835]
YRHFEGRGELLAAVRDHARRALADSMERTAVRAPGADSPALAAEARLASLCRGYVAFAVDQPGLYRSAFSTPRTASGDAGPEADTGCVEVRAFTLLADALDALGATARPPRPPRPAAEAAAWSAVHGLSLLLLDGPLRRLPAQRRADVVESTLAMVVSGTRAP